MTAKAKWARRGDHVFVPLLAGNGLCYVAHTPQEFADLMRGVDIAASVMIWLWTMSTPAE